MLVCQGTKVAKGTPARSDAKVVKTCGGFQAPLMVFSDFYEKQMVEDPPVNRGSAPTPVPEPNSEPEAETEQTEETPKEQTVTEVETYRMPQIPLPDELPRPGVPKKPSWWEIGWRRLMGRSVNDMIWNRWYPPEPSNYAELVCPCKDYVYLGEINEEELDRLDREIRKENPNVLLALTPHTLPSIGKPNSIGRQYNEDGDLVTERVYGPDGRAQRDIDYTDHGHPKYHPDIPHQHDWDWSKEPKDRRSKDPKPLDKSLDVGDENVNGFEFDPTLTKNVFKIFTTIGAGAGAGYIIYRGIRMVPSLLPPLWWTIPENLVIP